MLPSISELPPIGAEESILDEAPFPDHTLQSQEVNNDAENANHAADHESDAESIEEAPPKKKAKKDFEHDTVDLAYSESFYNEVQDVNTSEATCRWS